MNALTIERPVEMPVEAPATPDPDRLVVMVRQEHINRGVRRSLDACPIALAATETGLERPQMSALLSEGSWGERRMWLSREAYEFVRGFDVGRRVRPTRLVFIRVGAA